MGDDEGARTASSTSAATAAPASSASPRARCGASSAPTTRGATASTAASSRRRTPTRSRTSASPGLSRVRMEERHGLLFADVSGTAGPLDDHLGDLDAAPRALPARRARAPRRDHLRRRVELEGDRRELLRVPALPGRAPRAQPPQPLHERRRVLRRRRLVRRLDDAQRGRGDDGAERRPRAPPRHQGPEREGAARRPLLRALPQPARLAAPRLRDGPHAVAARRRAHRGRVRVVLRARDDGAAATSIPPMRSASGTWSTARTGRCASSSSAASARAGTSPAATPTTSRPSTPSTSSWPTRTWRRDRRALRTRADPRRGGRADRERRDRRRADRPHRDGRAGLDRARPLPLRHPRGPARRGARAQLRDRRRGARGEQRRSGHAAAAR